jgi:hypothetical protein
LIQRNVLLSHLLHRILIWIPLYFLAVILVSCGGGGGGDGGGGGGGLPSISGRVTSGGSGLAGVTVTFMGNASSATVSTDASGNYQISTLPIGPCVITPSKAGYTITPSSRTVFVTNTDIPGQDFSALSVTWAKTYAGGNDDVAHCVRQTSDGGFVVAGETYSFGIGNSDVWVLKLDVNGNIQWQKTYGGSGYDVADSIQQTSDGGYIVAGETSSFSGNTEVWILKLDGNGSILWQNRYAGGGVDVAHSIQQSSDGGFIVAGETDSSGAGGIDAFVFKLKLDGSIDWQKAYGGADDDVARSIQQTSDGGFIVAGETKSFGAGDVDIWVLKLDANGGVVWQKTYGGVYDDVAYSAQQTSDGGYIVAGGRAPADPIVNDVFLLKLDANGGVVWQKTYGGVDDEVAYFVQQTSDGGYIIAGKSSSFGNFFGDMWVLKVKSNGDIVWQKIYGGNDSNSANFIRQISDGGYILAGETWSFGAGYADAWVLKLDGNGDIGSGCTILAASNGTATTSTMTAANSSATVTITTGTATPTSVSANNSGATTTIQCSSP